MVPVEFVLTAVGSVAGALLRFELGLHLSFRWGTGFPWATLFINLLGSLMAGMALAIGPLSPGLNAVLVAGLLGGFTTVSAFALETHLLVERGRFRQALVYALCSLLLMLSGAASAFHAVRMFSG